MSNKNPSKKTRFKPGVSGNPSGRPSADPVALAFKRVTAAEYEQVANALMLLTVGELEKLEADKNQTVLSAIVVKTLMNGVKMGGNFETLLTRLIGAPKGQTLGGFFTELFDGKPLITRSSEEE